MRNLYSFTMDTKNWFDTAAFLSAVEKILNDSFSNSRLFGLCLTIHYKEEQTGQAVFCRQIAAYLESSITHPEQAASFICGLFLIARDVLFTDPHILEAIDRVIANADQETFLTILPNLRYAFTGFLPAEVNRLGQQVAEYHQIAETRLTGSITVSQQEITEAMRLDKLAAEALKTWRIIEWTSTK